MSMPMNTFQKLIALAWLALAAFAVVALTDFLYTNLNNTHTDTMVMRSYEVPAEQAEQIADAVGGAMRIGDKEMLGKVAVAPNGQLLVTAPLLMQGDISTLIEQARKAPMPAMKTFQVDVWFVQAEAAKDFAVRGHLGEVEKNLRVLADKQGPMQFTLMERVSLNSQMGRMAVVNGGRSEAKVRINEQQAAAGKPVALFAELGTGPNRLALNLDVVEGRTYIVGQSLDGRAQREGDQSGGDRHLIYLLRVSLPDAN